MESSGKGGKRKSERGKGGGKQENGFSFEVGENDTRGELRRESFVCKCAPT